jgi:hypothetical protein
MAHRKVEEGPVYWRSIMKWFCGSFMALSVLVCLAALCRADDRAYQDLLRRLPDSTNVVVVADVPALRKTLGLAPGSAVLQSDVSSVPIAANTFVMGAHVDLSEHRHVWSIAMCQHPRKMTIEDIAKLEDNPAEEVAGFRVVPSIRNAYFIELAPDMLGVGSPANRQQLKRWLTYQKSNQVAALSPYLAQAADLSDAAVVVMAVDLADSVDASAIHRGLNGSQVLGSRKKINYAAVEKTLVRVKGLTFAIQPGSPLTGTLTVDFNDETTEIQGFAKALLIEILQHAGVYVRDFDDWKPRLKDRSIGLSGPLSLNGFRKFCTLIGTPVPQPEAADMANYKSMSPLEQSKVASQRYFKSVTQALKDLKEDKTKSVKGLAEWYDRYADQIAKLPILNVDPDLINFAAATSENLRAMSASLKGISLQSGYLQQQKTEGQIYNAPNYTGNYSGYNAYGGYWGGGAANLANNMALYRSGTAGGVTTVNNYAEVYQQQLLLVKQGEAGRVKLWQRIDDETADIRRKMTMKYQTEF